MRLVAVAEGQPVAAVIESATIEAPTGLEEAVPGAIVGTAIAIAAIVGACSFQNR